jgi:hypothetical protein
MQDRWIEGKVAGGSAGKKPLRSAAAKLAFSPLGGGTKLFELSFTRLANAHVLLMLFVTHGHPLSGDACGPLSPALNAA